MKDNQSTYLQHCLICFAGPLLKAQARGPQTEVRSGDTKGAVGVVTEVRSGDTKGVVGVVTEVRSGDTKGAVGVVNTEYRDSTYSSTTNSVKTQSALNTCVTRSLRSRWRTQTKGPEPRSR